MHFINPRNSSQQPAWLALQAQRLQMNNFNMHAAFNASPGRFDRFSVEHQGILLDYSKNLLDETTLQLLFKLAQQCQLESAISAMFDGARINSTEQRPALHCALRLPAGSSLCVDGQDVVTEVHQAHRQMEQLAERIHNGSWRGYTGNSITDVVNIGIGGSFLGPQLAVEALQPFHLPHLRCHFMANIDSSEFYQLSRQLDPARTLFIVSSKSFGTLETLKNASAARQWLLNHGASQQDLARHFIAVSSNIDKAVEFGIAQENILPMWDWVGGRYSLWSAIGLPIVLAAGMPAFKAMLAGAHAMDQHFQHTPWNNNMPVIMGLLGIWYINCWNAHSHAVLPYDNYLRSLPDYLQQLDMESNGKQVRHDGTALGYSSGPIIWGNIGTNGQHAYHQLLLQGTSMIPADFIVAVRSQNPIADHQQWLYANCLSQSQALMRGKSRQTIDEELREQGYSEEQIVQLAPHKEIPGNRPSNSLVLDQLDPERLGALIALYEHKVYVQSVIWGVNAFDQWGVELGKQLGDSIYQLLDNSGKQASIDGSTMALVNRFQQKKQA